MHARESQVNFEASILIYKKLLKENKYRLHD